MTLPASWSTFDMSTVDANAVGSFCGGAFDGRYVYFAQEAGASTYVGRVSRYDTQGSFTAGSSWSTFDVTTVDANANGFISAAFDGRYLYLSGYQYLSGVSAAAARYDTRASFAAATSWSTFDPRTVNSAIAGFEGSTFDGRYVYFVPRPGTSVAARYDTRGSFTTGASWSSFDTTTLDARAAGFAGGVFDGRYVYLVPFYGPGYVDHGVAVRFDTTQPSFAASSAWASFDVTSLNPGAMGFNGAAFDGRFIYFVPNQNTGGAVGSTLARYDTRASFTAAASWSFFDTTSVDPNAKCFNNASFDGRYVYLVPVFPSGRLLRYDTQGSLTAVSSWSALDMTTVDPQAAGYYGAVFDGRFLYLGPYALGSTPAGGTVARFDAKTPPSMPELPEFFGSFY
jgi:hypothetical protein